MIFWHRLWVDGVGAEWWCVDMRITTDKVLGMRREDFCLFFEHLRVYLEKKKKWRNHLINYYLLETVQPLIMFD